MISSDGELREAAWQSSCPVMQLGRIQFACRMGIFRKRLHCWKLGPWKHLNSDSKEYQDLEISCQFLQLYCCMLMFKWFLKAAVRSLGFLNLSASNLF
jgi:hypothetical protein